MQNAYWRTNISGLPFLFLTLEFDPTDDMLTWATNLITTQFPDDLVVIITHNYIYSGGTHSSYLEGLDIPGRKYGTNLWNELIYPVPNVVMVLSGHWGNGSGVWPHPNADLRIVNELYLNYQGLGCNGNTNLYPDMRTSAVARRMIVDPLKNSVSAANWDCRKHDWLTNALEDVFEFPLFELQEPGQ